MKIGLLGIIDETIPASQPQEEYGTMGKEVGFAIIFVMGMCECTHAVSLHQSEDIRASVYEFSMGAAI